MLPSRHLEQGVSKTALSTRFDVAGGRSSKAVAGAQGGRRIASVRRRRHPAKPR